MLLALALVLTAGPSPGQRLPTFSLPDPSGRVFTSASLKGRPVVLVVTAPTLDQGEAQNGWSDLLDAYPWDPSGAFYAWVEDLSQSWFKDLVRGKIRDRYAPPPTFLLDETGALRKALGVGPSQTVALVLDGEGVVQLVEPRAPTAARARAVWERAQALLGHTAETDAGAPR